jgi:hypothetical protein
MVRRKSVALRLSIPEKRSGLFRARAARTHQAEISKEKPLPAVCLRREDILDLFRQGRMGEQSR